MKLSQFITEHSAQIISEWEEFARTCLASGSTMDLEGRRDQVEGMLKEIAIDIDTPQTARDQTEKSRGKDDAAVNSDTASNAHGIERAATGYTAVEMVAEFRALRASVLRLWSKADANCTRANLDELCRFNEAIDQALAESIARYAEEVARSKDLFLGVLGHDLTNPIGAIKMSMIVMSRAEGPEWRHGKAASRILNSCTRMEGIVHDLLDFTSTRLGPGIPVTRAPMDMETICRQTVEEITAFHPERAVQFSATGNLLGSWDAGRMGQVLSNLVGNAHQHGATDAPLCVAVRGEPDAVVMTVHNQGAAIAAADLHVIFSPFRQLDPATSTASGRSIGLGLYIAQAIVHAHRGTIQVESNANGTTFTVRLPRAACASEAPRSAA